MKPDIEAVSYRLSGRSAVSGQKNSGQEVGKCAKVEKLRSYCLNQDLQKERDLAYPVRFVTAPTGNSGQQRWEKITEDGKPNGSESDS